MSRPVLRVAFFTVNIIIHQVIANIIAQNEPLQTKHLHQTCVTTIVAILK
jgi:hypothetical protein